MAWVQFVVIGVLTVASDLLNSINRGLWRHEFTPRPLLLKKLTALTTESVKHAIQPP
mgnify:CR=1 FL=1